MSDGTTIEWCDATWNPITGCSVVSPGCTNCYAMRLAGTRLKHHASRVGLTTMTKAGPVWTGEVRFNERVLDQPLRWRKPRRIFVCAHGDLLHEAVPDEWLQRVVDVMRRAPQHQFLVLTKRAARCADIPSMPNVWVGCSAETAGRLAEQTSLVYTLHARKWYSIEPLLEQIDLTRVTSGNGSIFNLLRGVRAYDGYPIPSYPIHWVVVGGESGPNARPCKVEWVRSIVQQCQAARVPVFVKQLGSNCDIPLRHQKGGDPSEWPEDLRVRQWPAP